MANVSNITLTKLLHFNKNTDSKVYEAISRNGDSFIVKQTRVTRRTHMKKLTDKNYEMPFELYALTKLARVGVVGVVNLHTYMLGDENKTVYFVFKKKPRMIDLFDHIGKNGRICDAIAMRIFKATVETLKQVHAAGIIHNDVKDENILIDVVTGETMLIDFGSSFKYPADGIAPKSMGRQSTQIHMPPEYHSSTTDTFDVLASTVWSLGCLLYTMIFGSEPFDSVAQIGKRKFSYKWHDTDLVMDLVHQCLVVDVSKRIKFGELLDHPYFLGMSVEKVQE